MMLRHTRPDIPAGICYGQSDLDVAESFESEVQTLLARLPTVSQIVTSPLRRCRKLADAIAEARDLSVQLDARFKEMDFGRWENVAWEAVPRHELDAWAENFYHARPHGGESVAQLNSRVEAAVLQIRTSPGDVLIVTHSGVIRAALKQYQRKFEFGEMIHLPEQEGPSL